jgi:hypothetical protein
MTDEKVWYKSKTMWINICIVVGGVAVAIADSLQNGVPITVCGLIGIVMRTISSGKITLTE